MIIPISMISQESKQDNKNLIGLYFSNNLCNQIEKIDDLNAGVELPDGSSDTYKIDYKYKYGFRLGLDYNLHLNNRISFSLESNYSQINLEKNTEIPSFRIVNSTGNVTTIDGGIANLHDKHNFISFNQSIKYKTINSLTFNFFASIGITEDLILNSNYIVENDSESTYLRESETKIKFKERKLNEKISLGLISKFGCEKDIKGIRLSFAFNYYYDSILRFDSRDNYHLYYGGIEIGIKKPLN